MIALEKEFVSGEGGFSAEPLTYKQVKREGLVAVYERSRDGKVKDYEVIIIRVDPKGKVFKFPGGVVKTLDDDKENYPSTGQWGKVAWSCGSLDNALRRFERVQREALTPEVEEEKTITIPIGEFTTTELAESNQVSYMDATLFIRAAVENGTVKLLKEEHRNATGKGKKSKIYIKA